MKDHFVLLGPGERKKGREKKTHHPAKTTTVSERTNAPVGEELTERPLVGAPLPVYPEEELMGDIKNQYHKDPLFKIILDAPRSFKNFELKDRVMRLKLKDRTVICVPDVKIKGRRLQEMVMSQAHSLLTHLGARKTLTYLRDHVWWKTMVQDVNAFCETCTTCQRSKSSNQPPYGLLRSLSVPSHPWEAIGIDFVGPLPLSKNRDTEYDSVTVVIDLLTGMVHLVPSRTTYTAREVAELIFSEVYKLHGLPKSIISDRDVLFTSGFWTHLQRLIGVKQ
jgi:hypothetical protein